MKLCDSRRLELVVQVYWYRYIGTGTLVQVYWYRYIGIGIYFGTGIFEIT